MEDRNCGLRIETAKTLLNNLPNIEKFKKPISQTNIDNNDQVTNVYKESNQLLKVSR